MLMNYCSSVQCSITHCSINTSVLSNDTNSIEKGHNCMRKHVRIMIKTRGKKNYFSCVMNKVRILLIDPMNYK